MSRIISSCTTGGDIGSDHLPTITRLKLESSTSIKKSCNNKEWASSLDQAITTIELGDSSEVENDLKSLEDRSSTAKNLSTKILP